MDNNALVKLVSEDEFYLSHKSPRDKRVIEAMKKVDRRDFIPESIPACVIDANGAKKISKMLADLSQGKNEVLQDFFEVLQTTLGSSALINLSVREQAYMDQPVPIGYNQTCSQPSMVGFICDLLELEKGMKVLEVGAGCGYHAAVTSHLIGKEGRLTTIEYLPEIEKLARSNLEKHFGEKFSQRLKIIQGDGSVGSECDAPFDRIYLTAGIRDSFNPEVLAKQLNPKGGMLLFPEQRGNFFKQIYSKGKMSDEKKYYGVRFVPLKGKNS